MTPKEKDLKLLEYENKDLSMKEEIEFYEKANIPYFARIDTDTEYYTEHYYERIYLTKEKIKKYQRILILYISMFIENIKH